MFGLNFFIKNGKPEMKIILNNNIYFPGEIIKGDIFLKSGNFLEKGIIIYEIYGHEKINTKYKECNNSTKIFHISLNYPGLIKYSITKGISIPFQINLPSYILPSFEYSINNNKGKNYGYIKNIIQITIPELKLIKKKLIIIRRPITKLNSYLIFNAEKNENILGILNKECPKLIASYDKNYYFFNEEIPIKLLYSNKNCKIHLKFINIKLIRNIIFKFKENSKDSKIKDDIFIDELFNENININEKIDLNNKNKDINIEIKIKLEESENIFNKNQVDYLNLGLKDKSNLILFLPSFESSLIKCIYLIKIEGIYDTILPISNLSITMPISVYHNKNIINYDYNEFSLLNSKNKIFNSYEKEKENNNEINRLIDKPKCDKEEKSNQIENINNINNNINKNEKELEVKTYRNDEEKAWNNITNGQIIPELYKIDKNN